MFNIYTYEKRLNQEKYHINRLKREENIEQNRKSKPKFII